MYWAGGSLHTFPLSIFFVQGKYFSVLLESKIQEEELRQREREIDR